MTSEELELEQIQREREEVKKMMKKNMDLYNRTKSGTTTIVSKVRDTIYGLNNLAKNNNNIINKNSGYSMNFLREKAMHKINQINKKINENKMKQEQQPNTFKGKTIEIINTDIFPQNNMTINDNDNKIENVIELNEEKENTQQAKENENEIIINQENSTVKKTPNKENSYLTKIKQLGSMSKLDLYNKIQKYTEICQEVLEEQEKFEQINQESEKKQKDKKKKKGSKK